MKGESIPVFEDIVREQTPAITAFARSMTRNSPLTEDIVQETFIRAWRYLPTYRNEGSLQGWLIRICQNVARTTLKNQRATDELPDDMATRGSEFESSDLMTLIDQLPDDHRTIVTLCIVLGYGYEDVADILGIPTGTVRSRLFRARQVLQNMIATTHDVSIAQVG